MATGTRTKALAIKHIALIASLGLIVLSVARIYWFSALSVPVALAVLSVADRASVLSSTIINVLTIAAPLLLFFGPARRWLLAGNDPGAPFLIKLRTALIWVPLSGVLLGSVTPPFLLGYLVAVVLIVVFAVRRTRKKEKGKEVPSAVVARRSDWLLWGLATLIAYWTLQVISPAWQPVEVVAVRNYEEPIVGYVIGESSGQTLIINRSKYPVWVPTKDIGTRELCAGSKEWWARPLIDNLVASDMPLCPKRAVPDPIPTPMPTPTPTVLIPTPTPTPSSTPTATTTPTPAATP